MKLIKVILKSIYNAMSKSAEARAQRYLQQYKSGNYML